MALQHVSAVSTAQLGRWRHFWNLGAGEGGRGGGGRKQCSPACQRYRALRMLRTGSAVSDQSSAHGNRVGQQQRQGLATSSRVAHGVHAPCSHAQALLGQSSRIENPADGHGTSRRNAVPVALHPIQVTCCRVGASPCHAESAMQTCYRTLSACPNTVRPLVYLSRRPPVLPHLPFDKRRCHKGLEVIPCRRPAVRPTTSSLPRRLPRPSPCLRHQPVRSCWLRRLSERCRRPEAATTGLPHKPGSRGSYGRRPRRGCQGHEAPCGGVGARGPRQHRLPEQHPGTRGGGCSGLSKAAAADPPCGGAPWTPVARCGLAAQSVALQ